MLHRSVVGICYIIQYKYIIDKYSATAYNSVYAQQSYKFLRSIERKLSEIRENGGSLSEVEYARVMEADYSDNDYQEAFHVIMSAGMGLPDHSFVEMGAKIIKALGKDDQRLRAAGWLMPEIYIFLGKL